MKIKKFFITLFTFFTILNTCITPIAFADSNETDLNITSEAAFLIDTNTGIILYGKNENEKKYPASITKILTAIIVIENCDLNDKVTVSYDAISLVPYGYQVAALQVGEELTVGDLVKVLLIHSANDAANVLALHVGGSIEGFASMMNSKAQELGCKNSHFVNPCGQHDEEHYTTAADIATIMKYCMQNPTFKSIASSPSCIIPATNKYEERVFTNTNELLIEDTREVESNYYYPYAIAGKTGYTSQAKDCLVSVAQKENLELICVVLGAGELENGLSARFIETKEIFEYGFNTYTIAKLKERGAIATQIEVKNATKKTKDLNLIISKDIIALVKQSDLNNGIEPEITLNENLSAPIRQGAKVGTLKYNIEGVEYETDLVAAHEVKKISIIFYILKVILILLAVIVIVFILFILYKYYLFKRYCRRRKRKAGNHNRYRR